MKNEKQIRSKFNSCESVENMTEYMPKILGIVADNPQLDLISWRISNNRIAPDKLKLFSHDKASIEVEFFDNDTESTKIVTFESFKKLDNLLVKRLNELRQFYSDLHLKQLQKLATAPESKNETVYYQLPIIDIDQDEIPF